MKLEIDLELTPNQLLEILKKQVQYKSEFDEVYKLNIWFDVLCSQFNDEDSIQELTSIFERILHFKRN